MNEVSTIMKKKTTKPFLNPDDYDFPKISADDEYYGQLPISDGVDLLHQAAIFERWAEIARNCGKEELAENYQTISDTLHAEYMERDEGL